jgi:hypothetical protein
VCHTTHVDGNMGIAVCLQRGAPSEDVAPVQDPTPSVVTSPSARREGGQGAKSSVLSSDPPVAHSQEAEPAASRHEALDEALAFPAAAELQLPTVGLSCLGRMAERTVPALPAAAA